MIATTTHVASGIFVPMLVIGSTAGRIIGIGVVELCHALGVNYTEGLDGSGTWEWIDPGVFALIGCGAFMGGLGLIR